MNIPCFLKEDLQNISFLKDIKSDFFVVVNFGKIFPQELLDLPQKACLNIHFSLLPCWRGASPVRSCLLAGDKYSGVSIIKMMKELDAGDILLQKKIKLSSEFNHNTLTSKLVELGCETIWKTLQNYDSIKPKKQEKSKVSYCYKIKKEQALVDWDKTAKAIYQLYQAFTPQPGIFSYWKERRVFLRKISILNDNILYPQTGIILKKSSEGLQISTNQGILFLEKLQMENKKILDARDWFNGYRVQLKDQFTTKK